MCYARFDGEWWVQPHLPNACLNALPRIQNSGGPRYHKEGIVDPNGNSIFFEDLGVLIWKNNGWIYGSFYDYGTYPKPDDEHRQGWPPPLYLRTEPRSAVSPKGIVWLWGIPESDKYKHVPSGVKCILRWDGTSLIAKKDFRDIPAEQIREICFLPNGDAWVLATQDAKSGKAWPVLVDREPNSNLKSSTQLKTTSGEVMDLLQEGRATLLFDSGEHVYVAIERCIFRLLPNGLCHEMSDYPWNSIYGNSGFSCYKVGPKNLWLVAMINQS